MTQNRGPEQIARDNIDDLLKASDRSVQDQSTINLNQGRGQVIGEYQTDIGPADYVFFVDKKAVGVSQYLMSNPRIWNACSQLNEHKCK